MAGRSEISDDSAGDCCREEPASGSSGAIEVMVLDNEALASMSKALGHPMRVRILRLLAERHSCMTGDLVAELPLAQSTISEHLRILRESGLIQGEIEGPRTSYCLDRAGLNALKAAVDSL